VRLERIDVPAKVPGPSRTLVLLHGFGADEHDLLPLARDLGPGLRVISLQAPIALEQGGRAWYRLQEGPDGISFDPEEVLLAGRIAREAIEEIAQESPAPLLCGFSQGAGMALGAALENPGLASAVLAFSAAIRLDATRLAALRPSRAEPAPPVRERNVEGLRVFLAHGTFDPLIPVEAARTTRDLLAKLGLDLTYREYPMGHMICADELSDARSFLAEAGLAGDARSARRP
jgi:phospholipase/carboxylesterase